MHGTGTAAALQLCEPQVLSSKRDGVLAPERVLLQTPALPGSAGPHGHYGKPGPVSPVVPTRVRETQTHTLTNNQRAFIPNGKG